MTEGTRLMTRREMREAAQRAAAADAAASVASGVARDSVETVVGAVPEALSIEPSVPVSSMTTRTTTAVRSTTSVSSTTTSSSIPTRRSLRAAHIESISPSVPTLVRPPTATAIRGLDVTGVLAPVELTGGIPAVAAPVVPVAPAPLPQPAPLAPTLMPSLPPVPFDSTPALPPTPPPALATDRPTPSPVLVANVPDDNDVDDAFDLSPVFAPVDSVAAPLADPVLPANPKAGRSAASLHRDATYTWLHYTILIVVAFVLGWLLWQFIDDGSRYISSASPTTTTAVGALSVTAFTNGEL